MQYIKDVFDGLGWLANAIGILVFVFGAIAILHRLLKRFTDEQDLSKFYTSDLDSSWDPLHAREFAVTTIVDDKPADFPSVALRAAGYRIEIVKSVNLAELDELAIKDVIFLDIKGIVKDDPERGGLHVIEKLRERNQFQKICAVSSQTFDPTATVFFRKADDQRTKPLTTFECQETIDRFIREMFQVDKIFVESNAFARTLSGQDRKQLIQLIQDFEVERSTDAQLMEGLRKITPLLGKQHVLYSLARIIQSENRRIRKK